MTKLQAQKLFDKYNLADTVTRCPNGRAYVRKLLDSYTRAAMNLYGVISRVELAEIFNSQNIEITSSEEIYSLLLPLVLKSKYYCFYKNYIVHYWAIDDFEYADSWILSQGDKPRFIPEKNEFLKFENQYYEDKKEDAYWEKLFKIIDQVWPNNYKKYNFYNELKEISKFNSGLQEVTELLDECGMDFGSEKQAQTFFNLLMDARNNTRLWSNKGFTPIELHKIMESEYPKNEQREIAVSQRKKVGMNDQCPCGSGKKYKKCCRLTEDSKNAQLSRSECTLFYETWYGLMGYINEQKKIIPPTIRPIYPNPVSDEHIYKVREVLWKNPNLISEYIASSRLSEEKISILKSWRDHHKNGMFFLVDYKPEYAVIIASNEKNEDRLYGIKGISRSISDAIQRELPVQFETVLLPFGDKIIYDCFMSSMPIDFAKGAKTVFKEIYDNALKYGIATSL